MIIVRREATFTRLRPCASVTCNPDGVPNRIAFIADRTQTWYLGLGQMDTGMSATIDVHTTPQRAAPIAVDFEDGTMPSALVTSADDNWQVDTTTGSASANSMKAMNVAIGNNACATALMSSGTTVSFDWKVDASAGDFLTFSIDGTKMDELSGSADWASANFPVPVGAHWLQWCYDRTSASWDSGANAGWVDNISVH